MLKALKPFAKSRGSAISDDDAKRVRDLVAANKMIEALDETEGLIQAIAPRYLVTLTLIRRRLHVIGEKELDKTITREVAAAAVDDEGQRVLRLVGRLQAPDSVPTAAEEKARQTYLKGVREDIENRLKVSIHSARFIDLGLDEAPAATYLPWTLLDSNTSHQFRDIDEAFDGFQRNLLLLGAPGSGKTTTLLHIAKRLLDEAQDDPDAPVPLVVNLSKFRMDPPGQSLLEQLRGRPDEPDEPAHRFERWLIEELDRLPGVSFELARRWIEGRRVAVLLDGLDEVDDSYRANLVRLLNETYLESLKDYPDAVVVICSRINEYLPLQDDRNTRLALRGAITLQPLSPVQIRGYLEAANASGLRAALLNDDSLYEIAKTPLTLSMMTLAYGGLAPEDIPTNLTLAARRHHLMGSYVERMLQRKERRDRNLPFFDDAGALGVVVAEYRFSPDRVNRSLGWLAVRLSVRMQTAVSMGQFYEFLTRNLDREREASAAWCVRIAQGVFGLVGIMILGLLLAPATPSGLVGVVVIALSLATLNLFTNRYFEPESGVLANRVSVAYYIVLGIAGLGVMSRAVAAVIPGGGSPYALGVIATCSIAAALVGVIGLVNIIKSGWRSLRDAFPLLVFALCVAAFLGSAGFAQYGHYSPETFRGVLATVLVIIESLAIAIALAATESPEDRLMVILVLEAMALGLVGLHLLGTWLMGPIVWYKTVPVIGSILMVVVYALGAYRFLLSVTLLLAAALGAVFGGDSHAVLWPILLLMFAGMAVTIGEANREIEVRIQTTSNFLEQRLGQSAGRLILTPATFVAAVLVRRLPRCWKRFLEYTTGALLLKRSADDVEFMHRLLRDYFALRELQPMLGGPDNALRLDAIRKLGYQGESAIDTLDEFVRDSDPDVREAAITAFGHISSPVVVEYISAALQDNVPGVRRAAVLGLKNLRDLDKERLIDLAVNDRAHEVKIALIEVLDSSHRASHESAERLILILRDTHEDVKLLRAAARLVGKQRLHSEQIDRRLLPRWAPQHLPSLFNDTETAVQSGALQLLASLGVRDSVDPFAKMLNSGRDAKVRTAAARILGLAKDPRVVEPLIQALGDRSKAVRDQAEVSLKRLARHVALEEFREVVSKLKHRRVRKRAAEILRYWEHIAGQAAR
jgi:HEAT repeat protein